MVDDTNQEVPGTDTPTPYPYTLIEQALISKTGQDEACEDAIYIGPHFVAVIDGATSKTERTWDNKKGGRIAAEIIVQAFDLLPPEATARQAVDIFTAAIHALYKQHDVVEEVQAHAVQRAVASFVAFSLSRKELWFVGDCQCLIDGVVISNKKEIDDITANARAAFLETEIAQGKTIAELRQNDAGRAFILPLLGRQMTFQNNPTNNYWYAVIDGFDVPDEGIRVYPLAKDVKDIVLASDGYPELKGNLEETEAVLQQILQEDPLLFQKYKATKGLLEGNLSFDDRAYVRLRLPDNSETEDVVHNL